jgi:hypothetical protein
MSEVSNSLVYIPCAPSAWTLVPKASCGQHLFGIAVSETDTILRLRPAIACCGTLYQLRHTNRRQEDSDIGLAQRRGSLSAVQFCATLGDPFSAPDHGTDHSTS